MYEVECKVATPHDPVRERLSELSAEPVDTRRQEDTYYDAPHRTFGETDEALRLRRENGTARLTYKGPLLDGESKTREEHETTVEDANETARILDALGFAPVATVEKTRETFRCRGYTVVLDTVAGLGEFVEVEGEATTEADIEGVRDGARELLAALGCAPDAQTRTSYLEMVLERETDNQ
jgi:adenylate cyclase class 2